MRMPNDNSTARSLSLRRCRRPFRKYHNSARWIPARLAAFGEISLAGEVRPVGQGRRRAAEAARLGYTRVLDESVGDVSDAIAAIRPPRPAE